MDKWKISKCFKCKIIDIIYLNHKYDYIESIKPGIIDIKLMVPKPHKFNIGDKVYIVEEETDIDKSNLSDENKKYIKDKVYKTRIKKVNKMNIL